MRTRYLLTLIALLAGAAAGVLPALSAHAADTNSFTAVDFQWQSATGGHTLTISPGDTVSFSYPSGASMHNADFGSSALPSACTVNGTSQSPPIPSVPTAPGWSAACTFTAAGTYVFHCDLHPSMTGTIFVGTTPTTTTTTSTTTVTTTTTTPTGTTGTYTVTPPTTTTTTPAPTPAPLLAGPARRAVRVPSRQRGTSVRGAVDLGAGARGARMRVTLLVARRQLRGLRAARPGKLTIVGRLRLGRLSPGLRRFAVGLSRVGAAALHRRGRLDLTVEIALTPRAGNSLEVTRHVRLRVVPA
jgi:plastocyanin